VRNRRARTVATPRGQDEVTMVDSSGTHLYLVLM